MGNDSQVKMDWRQVVLNGGPPCFFIEDGKYCGRAKRWQGHGVKTFHDFVSLDDLLATVRKEEREASEKVGRQALAAELLGHLDRITSTTAAFHFVRNICKIELGQEPDSLGAEIDH